ncbi:hypothetical protein H0H87_002492 [Tephrocybe sp. NHM501043]|nr:hypothetical protein H0H87_002492 [Tephrocybe sp. NHM501043]
MQPSTSLQIPSQVSLAGPRPVSAAVQQAQPPSSSRRQQRASHTVVSGGHANQHGPSSRDDVAPYTDVYSHPAAVAYATAHPRRTIPKFGPYLLLQTLGEGEFGKVKLGLHSQWGEEVAVKLIRRGNVDNSVRMSKVEREIEVLRTLKHPNIVRLYDVIETDKYIGIILEYASGGELFDHILAHRYLREKDAAKLFSQLISGVWYIHQKKIVHRDLKLENLLLDRHRNVIITDFGFANRFEHRSDDLMQTSCGSPCYAAPELVISEGLYVGSAVDIWSCGVILYAMLAGYLPFDDDPANPDGDNINLLYKYIVNTPLSFPEYISAEARDLLGMMLVPDPTRRSSLEAVMRHPWLAAYATPREGTPPAPLGFPVAFGRSVEQLERAALDQHQQRRLAYQRQMRAAAQSAQQQQQQQTTLSPIGRTQSQQVHASSGGHRQAATEGAVSTSGTRSQSTQPEFLYDSSMDVSTLTNVPVSSPVSASASRRPILGADDDPFGPPPSSTRTTLLAAEAPQPPKTHKASGSGSAAGGFRHTIQVEYDAEPRSQGQRRSEDREGRPTATSETQQRQQKTPQQSPKSNGMPPAVSPVPKERHASGASVAVPPTKPLPSTPMGSSSSGTSASTTPTSYRGVHASSSAVASPKVPATPTRSHSHHRTPSTPVVSTPALPVTPNISVNAAPASPVTSTPPVSLTTESERKAEKSAKTRTSIDRLGLGKVFNGGASSVSSGASAGASSPSRVPSDGGRSENSVLLNPPGEKNQKEEKEQEKKEETKKTRRNTLTVMVEPFRRKGTKGRAPSSSGEPVSGASTPSSTVNGKEKVEKLPTKSLQPPHSAAVGSARRDASFSGVEADVGVESGAGNYASTSKARKQQQVQQQPQHQHPWGALRTHHGAVDQSMITTKPPPEVIQHVRAVLESMGVEIQVESEYKYRCVRAKRRKGSMVMGGASTPPQPSGAAGGLAAVTMVGSAASNGVDKRGLPVPSPTFSAPGGMLRGLLMRRQSSQVSSSGQTDDDISSPLTAESGTILGATTYGDPAQDAGDEVKFSVELTRIDRLNDTFSLDIRRLKGNLRSYKFLYDTLRE